MRIRPLLLCAASASALVALVATPDPDSRATGASTHQGPTSSAAERAVAALSASSARARDDAAEALALLGHAAGPALEEAAAGPDPEVRARARGLLVRIRDDDDAASVRRTLEAEALLREDGLGGLEPGTALDRRLAELQPESGDALATLALRRSPRAFLDGRLARALVRHATPRSLETLALLWKEDRALPSAVLDAALDLDSRTRDQAAAVDMRALARTAVGTLGDPLVVREAPRRRAGLALVAALGGAAATETLLRGARDRDSAVRREAARVIARHVGGAGREALRALARDPDAAVRAAALDALAATPGTLDPGPAVVAAADPVPAVRRSAATLLGREATAAELPVLFGLARDDSGAVRIAARRSLLSLGLRAE